MMDIKKLVQPATDWDGQSWAERIDLAASTLFLHGYITMSAREKVTQKLEKQFREGLANGDIIKREEA